MNIIMEENKDFINEPFRFAYRILSMDIDTVTDIFPETGTVENIFKFYTYEEAKARYLAWLKEK